ncbi:trinucleotide repeat-containing gene 6A protein-like isoform X2 [Rana temporaria]|uniref:trinucleotide repeat-containing gene 6A protein-like isoform X2 n=1 Tax=Rana temporaria TaxID=8407 RepID=UPI001AADE3A9|nr:trinucleotide repeat-containing gene 6A protein-like isoform X2 [Rana temporaria]
MRELEAAATKDIEGNLRRSAVQEEEVQLMEEKKNRKNDKKKKEAAAKKASEQKNKGRPFNRVLVICGRRFIVFAEIVFMCPFTSA